MTNGSIKFFAFFADVFAFCAITEWVFAAEAVRHERRQDLVDATFFPASLAIP